MKKFVSTLLIIMLLFGALVVSPVQADKSPLDTQPVETSGKVGGEGAYRQYQDNGSASTGATLVKDINGTKTNLANVNPSKTAALNNDQDSYIARVFAWLIELISGAISYPLNWIMAKMTGQENEVFQIEKVVFNEYKIFDINFFKEAKTGGTLDQFMGQVRDTIAGWYYGMRTLAIMASLSVLIYIAIRMAISTATMEKAKYKRMFQSWLVSLLILFLLHYIIMIMVYLSDALVNMLQAASGNIGIEKVLKESLLTKDYKGWEALARAVMLLTFTFLQLKFFIIYFKRTIVAALLITISPLITVTYSIDKVADNKAQAFQNWMKEMQIIVFMQPMHALLFVIFAISASNIITFAPFIAVLVLWAISKGETILRGVLGLGNSVAVGSLQSTKLDSVYKM